MKLGLEFFREKDPGFVCVVDPNGRGWSRGELAGCVNRLARALRGAGLRDGNVVAIIAPNCAEFLVAYLAGVRAGLAVVPVNWHLADPELQFLLADSGARVVVTHASLGAARLERIRELGGDASLFLSIGTAPGYVEIADFAAAESDAPLNGCLSGRMMAYTSATTGRPKAVVVPARNAEASLMSRVEANKAVGILPEDDNVHLCASMLYHSAPLGGCELALWMGHRVVIVGHWGAELLLELIDEHRVTTAFFVPAMFVRLLKLPESVRSRYSLSSLRFVAHGAAPCPEGVKRRMLEWWGDVIWEAYGATEAQGTVASPADWLKYPGTVGRPMPGAALKILGDDGTELGANEIGRIYIRPHTGDFFKYKDDPEATRRSYSGEFITVGDLGYLNEDGYLFVCDRSGDLIISSGMNIYPAEIEGELVQHPSVRDCAVVGEPHALLGMVPKAFIEFEVNAERSPGPGPELSRELLRFLGDRLSAMKLPKRIEYVDEIPRDPSGKLFKRRLLARQEV